MASVRMWAGSPPPANPYTQPLAASRRPAAMRRRALERPDRRIEGRDGIGTLDDEREGTAGALVPVLHGTLLAALHPLLDAAPVHALEAGQGVSAEGDPPVDGCPNVGAEQVPVNAHDGIALGGELQPAE